jgi:hypothetical protein
MSRTSTALFILLGLFGAGCCASGAKPGASLSEHFTPALPIEIPKPLTHADLEGMACNSSVSGPIAQVFTTEAAGVLSNYLKTPIGAGDDTTARRMRVG